MRDDDRGTESGSVYVYRYDSAGGFWTLEQKLVAADGAAHDLFGHSLDLRGDRVVAGAS